MSTPRREPRHPVLFGALRGFLSVAGRLPLGIIRPAGRLIGAAAGAASSRDRTRAREHLRIAFPELDEDAREAQLKASARHFGAVLAEVAWLLHATPDAVIRLCSITGTEHLERPLREGTGAMLITGHCGNWELVNARLGVAGIPMTIAVRSVYDPRLDEIATSLRARFGSEVIPRGRDAGRRLIGALARNRVVGLLIDQDIADVPGVFVDFFGRPAWTPSGAAALALRRGCPVVPAFGHRRPDGSHVVEVHPPLPEPASTNPTDRVAELTASATAAIERQVRAHPEQWVWMHRRWRRQPQGETRDGRRETASSTGTASATPPPAD